MLRNWILGLFDSELLVKQFLILADSVEEGTRFAARKAVEGISRYLNRLGVGFLIACSVTIGIACVWFAMYVGLGWRSQYWFVPQVIILGIAWVAYLIFALPAFFAVDSALSPFPQLKARFLKWVRIPVAVGLATFLLATLVNRYEALRNPEVIWVAIGIGFALPFVVPTHWIKRTIVGQIILMAIIAMLGALSPSFPHGDTVKSCGRAD